MAKMCTIKVSKNLGAIVLVSLALTMLTGSISASNVDQVATNKDMLDEQFAQRNTKFMSLPSGLTRFLFYSARPSERQATGPAIGYKRSSSALDALTGVTLGKRSAAPVELLNLEPFFGRQFAMRSMPRMYDMRWAPFDAYEASGLTDMS